MQKEPISDAPLTATAALAKARQHESRGEKSLARNGLRQWVAQSPLPANIAAASRAWEEWEADPLPDDVTLRLSVLGTGTLGTLGRNVRVALAGVGLHPQIHVGEFNQWAQELLMPNSAAYAFVPEVIALFIDVQTLFPRTCADPFLADVEAEAERQSGVTALLSGLQAAAQFAPGATILLHTFAVPDHAPLGVLDAQMPNNQRERIARLNHEVAHHVREKLPRVLFLDQERAEARFGKARIRDPRYWYMASVPFTDEFLRMLAREYVRIIRPLKGLTRKCIVLDLDNTLWGGVIGEDGLAGLKLGGTTAPGNAFRDFQCALDVLRQRGVLLAVCSKNNMDDVLPVFQNHPEMVLRSDAFAAMRINWNDKATNLMEIARELNLGLDSLVFLDDNPAERGLVRERLPSVLTPDWPRDPAHYVAALYALDVFETIALTDEDKRRSALYAEQRERRAFENQFAALGKNGAKADANAGVADYLRDLQITVHLASATPWTIPRIAQLINKTNQFNVTTRRYTETEVRTMATNSTEWGVFGATVRDRFGDSGLTGLALVRKEGSVWEIDSFLLSCRVLGRGIEQALLEYVAKQAQSAGAQTLRGWFVPTGKNAPAADFYSRMGFVLVEEAQQGKGDGIQAWSAPPNAVLQRENSPWLTIIAEGEAENER